MTLFPSLRYRDAPAALRFLQDAFGFEVLADYRSEQDPDVVEHAELRWPEGGGVMLGSHREGAGLQVEPGHGSVYLVTADPDGLHDRATAAGAEIVRPLVDEEYGSREFTARDADGNYWSFGTYAGAAAS